MAGIDAFGAALGRSDMASSPTFTDVANVTDISGPGMSKSEIDVTAHDSPDKFKEFIGGVRDGGSVTFDLNWDPSEVTHQSLLDDYYDDEQPRDYMITHADGAITDFAGIVTGWSSEDPVDGEISASVTIKISGKPAHSPASS
jgi:predicted secreted protein